MKVEEAYKYFQASLREYVQRHGTGVIKRIAHEIGVSSPRVSQILTEGTKKPANFKLQVKIANIAGMSYEDFLLHGRMLIEGSLNKPDNLQVATFPNQETSKEIEVTSESDLLDHIRYQTQLISEGISMLREINENMKAMRKDFKMIQDPLSDVGEGKTKEGA